MPGVDARDPAALDAQAFNLALLDDVDAGGRGRTRAFPGDCVVPHGAAARLQKAAEYRVAPIIEICERHQAPYPCPVELNRVHSEETHLIGAPREKIALRLGVEKVERAALTHHGVEIQLPLEPLPQL